MWQYNYGPELSHHGIKGQKWGRRRFQKNDGSLTPAGRERYDDDNSSGSSKKTSTSKKTTATTSKKTSTSKKTTTTTSNKTSTAKKTSKKKMTTPKKTASDVVAGLGKSTVASIVRYRQNQRTYDAINSMMSGDWGSMYYNSLMSRSYGNINRFLYE